MTKITRAAIIPAGSWGGALAIPLAANGIQVSLWMRNQSAADSFNSSRLHPRLPGVLFPPGVTATGDPADALDGAELLVIGAPSHALREVLGRLRPLLTKDVLLVSITKGIEPDTLLRMSQVIREELPGPRRLSVLSGPNFAIEVARQLPAATVVAAPTLADSAAVQEAIMTPAFRVYTHHDVAGVEVGGALKNVVALAAGIADGLQVGYNASAALITRGLAEIARLGVALGAHPLTFAGLAGMGDLVLTCTGEYSRNRRAGLLLSQGQPLDQVLSTVGVVEGVPTTKGALALARRQQIPMPVAEQVHRILFEGVNPREGVMALMSRERTHELELAGTAAGDPAMEEHLSLYLKSGGRSRSRR